MGERKPKSMAEEWLANSPHPTPNLTAEDKMSGEQPVTVEDYDLANAIKAALLEIAEAPMAADDVEIIFRHVFSWHSKTVSRGWKCPECGTKMLVCDEADVAALIVMADHKAEEQQNAG